MKNLFLIFLLVVFFIETNAQQTKSEVVWGPLQKESRKSNFDAVIGYDASGIYITKVTRTRTYEVSEVSVVRYDSKMKPSKAVTLNLTFQNKDLVYEFAIQLNGVIYIYSSFENHKLNKKFLFVQSLNKNTLQVNQDLKKIAEIGLVGKGQNNSGYFGSSISTDSTKLLVYYSLPYVKGSNDKFGVSVFDNNMTPLWNQIFELPYRDELFEVVDYEIDNNGDFYLLSRVYPEKRKGFTRAGQKYKYVILTFFDKGEKSMEYPVDVEGKFINEMNIAISEQNDIICAGFYSTSVNNNITGSFFLKINNKSNSIVEKKFNPFGIDFLTQDLTDRQEKKVKKKAEKGKDIAMFEYDLRDLIIKSDGGIVLIGEQYYVNVYTTTYTTANGGMHTTTNYEYHYNDIIVVNIKPSGDLEWAEKIPKRQVSTNDHGYYSSFTLAVVGSKLFFVYNDNPKNLKYKNDGVLYSAFLKGTTAFLVSVDGQGRQERYSLFGLNPSEIIILPKYGTQISEDELIMFGKSGKKQKFAKVKILD